MEKLGNYAIPHKYLDGKHSTIPWVPWENVQATGGLISSVHDMALWMIANMNHGILEGDTLFNIANRNLMWTPHSNIPIDHTRENDYGMHWTAYGLGWFLGEYHGNFRVRHGGGYDGMISSVQMLPDEKLGVVVLTNGVKVPTNAIVYYIFDRFLGRDMKDWSADMLERRNDYENNDTRIEDLKKNRVENTVPSFNSEDLKGTYYAETYGDIKILEEDGEFVIEFTRSPGLKATLKHWHYDTYVLDWLEEQAWFSFGTVTFTADQNHNVKGIEFFLPNDDIFLDELNAKKK
jgi:hypothetical protein